MKNILLNLLLAVAVGLGAFAYHQSRQTAQNHSELLEVQTQLATAQAQLKATTAATDKAASVERSSKALQETLVKTSQFAREKEKQAVELQQKLADTKTNSNNPMAGMAKMLNDPKMKEMIRSQQKAVMGPIIEKQYGALIRQLNLTDDQGGQLKQLLTDKMLSSADVGMSMMDDGLDTGQRAELAKKVKTQSDEYDAQVKQLMGDNYPAFQSYEKSVPDRLEVSQFGDQLSGGLALNDSQQSQLQQALSDARTGFKWTTDFNREQDPGKADFSSLFTEEKLNVFTTEKEQFDQQFLGKAQTILSPEQFKEFQAFQKTQRDMQMLGLKMAAQMFGAKK